MATETKSDAPIVRIQLTKEQRKRVRNRTGQDIEILEISDPNGHLSSNLSGMKKIEVEKMAYREAGILMTQEEYDEFSEKKAIEDAEKEAQTDEKLKALDGEIAAETKEIEAAMAAAFAVEGQAVEAGRTAAVMALDAAVARHEAQNKKKRGR